ncbi:MAG: CCA tRNA nucleotidyltransferase, partial [Planctomycetota bacterium]
MHQVTPPDEALRALRHRRSAEGRRIIRQLREAGFVAYLAGGCVRDALLGRVPKDFDVATNAKPDAVREVFGKRKTLAFGASFGVVAVLPDRLDAQAENAEPTEVATFRSDGSYSDGRRPDSVHFGNAKADALRRDFTINGLFFDPDSESVIDYVGGINDLQASLIRTIGDPEQRFGEDKLRMLRAVRFATTLGFTISSDTQSAVRRLANEVDCVSGERIGAEMRRVLASPSADQGIAKLEETGLRHKVWPELSGVSQEQAAAVLSARPQLSAISGLAATLVAGDDPLIQLRGTAKRWKLSGEESRRVESALKHWRTITTAT